MEARRFWIHATSMVSLVAPPCPVNPLASPRPRDSVVVVEQAAETIRALHVAARQHDQGGGLAGSCLVKTLVRSSLVIVLPNSANTVSRCRRPKISGWSRHSRRTVPSQRSANAFARGPIGQADRLQVLAAEDLVEGSGELGVPITEEVPCAETAVPEGL
jgi:hypothetical protein